MEPTPNNPNIVPQEVITDIPLVLKDPYYWHIVGEFLSQTTSSPTTETGSAEKTSMQVKLILWEASEGYSGVDITRQPGDDDRFRHEMLPKNSREWKKAQKISKHETHKAEENINLALLETGTYSIDRSTGLSTWRAEDGSLNHVSGKTRRQIARDERSYAELKERIVSRSIGLVGRDPNSPENPRLSDDEISANTEAERLANLINHLTVLKQNQASPEEIQHFDEEIARQEEVARAARIKAGNTRKNFLDEAKTNRAQQELNHLKSRNRRQQQP